MERPGKFDQEIRKKMLPLEDEPSAAVWAGIRGEIGPAMPASGTAPWVYQVMVAASVALMVALAVMLTQKNKNQVNEIAKGGTEMPQSPTRPRTDQRNFAAQPTEKQEFESSGQPWYGPAYPAANRSIAAENEGEPIPEYRKQPKFDQDQITPQPEQFVEQTPDPKKEKPDAELVPVPLMEKDEVFAHNETNQDVNRQGKNRKIRLPRTDELTLENLKSKSKGILGTLASGARDVLGIDANYEQEEKENMRTTAFSANFGLFKVKKVQTVKKSDQ